MLFSTSGIRGRGIRAVDGELGHVDDVLFDDRSRVIRYVVADTGRWLTGRRVLLPREVVDGLDGDGLDLAVDLTRDALEHGPGLDSDPPLARDTRLRHYRGLTWTSHPWGGFVGRPRVTPRLDAGARRSLGRNHLRSVRGLTGYRMQAADGPLGHVADLLFTGADWTIRYVVIDTRDWLPGSRVVLPTEKVSRMDWVERTGHLALSRGEIESSPTLERADSHLFGSRLLVVR